MALDTNLTGGAGNTANVSATNKLQVILPTGSTPSEAAAAVLFSENDSGALTGTRVIQSPETDEDYRLRVTQDAIYDDETFNYLAQNTGKHNSRTTTMVANWTANGYNTNSTAITTTTTGSYLYSYAEFPLIGQASLYAEFNAAFTTAATSGATIDFGFFRAPTTTPYAPTDGAFFRMSSAGLTGVVNNNTIEVSVGPFAAHTINQKYQFIIAIYERSVEFWIDGNLAGSIATQVAQGQPYTSTTLPIGIRQGHVGAAGAGISMAVADYTVSLGGTGSIATASAMGNRMLGSYQGLSGGTMGSLATLPNSANPTAAVPSNTVLTANLPGGLGGQGVVTAALAAVTDGIWGSYQVPAGTVAIQGRRLVLLGVRISAVNTGAAVATTATTIQFALAFGHSTVSLAQGEAATTKAPRRVALGFMTWAVGAGIGAGPQGGDIFVDLGVAPIYVNSGEYIALAGKFLVGTATGSQTITFVWQPVYGWE